ncbi:alpha/beta hydrolase [Candidimonas nitroreducens]|uniref:Dienelactone hydrolase domain-containing protein n=1 Tax=Candidimonas nitroreducens TaxID=683354 RepID=A0A225MSC0_9BURK|nr:dienelactone hydrolase family protein [Candidimonas nitroreducens]OWT63952.1 hypothetical protein CEY11_06540 [Candidimonas nitroreducens]
MPQHTPIASHLDPAQPGIHRFSLQRDGHEIPVTAWVPEGRAHGLVLACHGGSGHKESGAILAIVDQLLPRGYVVAAPDGPVHGQRRADGSLDPIRAKNDFRAAWRQGKGRFDIAADFVCLLDALQQQEDWAALPVGYIGVSMGTAYGLPLLASEARIKAAAIGLWSTTYAASEHLEAQARQISCPVWFTQQWNDEAFDHPGTHALFDAIGSADKRLVAYPGPHKELEGERLSDAVEFLVQKLQAA